MIFITSLICINFRRIKETIFRCNVEGKECAISDKMGTSILATFFFLHSAPISFGALLKFPHPLLHRKIPGYHHVKEMYRSLCYALPGAFVMSKSTIPSLRICFWWMQTMYHAGWRELSYASGRVNPHTNAFNVGSGDHTGKNKAETGTNFFSLIVQISFKCTSIQN